MSTSVSPRGPRSAGDQPPLVFPQRFSRARVSESLPPGQHGGGEATTGGLLRASSGGESVVQASEGVGVNSSHPVPSKFQPVDSISSFPCVAPEESNHSFHYNHKASHHRSAGLCFYLRHRLRLLIGHVEVTPALAAAKTQRTPCGINRYLLLSIYFLYSFLTARVYFAWPSLSNLLFRSNAYIWLCDPESPDLRLREHGGRRYRCEAQNSQVGSLFVTCLTFAFSCSLLAGVLLDFFGPKITALIGQLCNMLAWLLLAFAGKDAQTYFPAFIFMGIGSDVGYLPVLSSANLFPGHEGLVVACLGAAKSLSFAIPAILDAVEHGVDKATLKDVSLGYVAFGPALVTVMPRMSFCCTCAGFCVLLSLLLIPLQAFVPWNEFVYLEDEPALAAARPLVRVNDSFASYEAHAWRESFSSFQDVKDWMHQHHLATPLEEITHTGAALAPSTRGPLLSSGFLEAAPTGIAPIEEGEGGSAPTSKGLTTGQQAVNIDRTAGDDETGGSLAIGSGTRMPISGFQNTGGRDMIMRRMSDHKGSKQATGEAKTGHDGREEAVSTALYGSISTEACLPSAAAHESGISANTELMEGEEADGGNVQHISQLRHPRKPDSRSNEAVEKTVAQIGGRSKGPGELQRKEDKDVRGAAGAVDRSLSPDTSACSPATAEAGKHSSNLDEATPGGETAAATTGSEAGAAAAAAEEGTPVMTLTEAGGEGQTPPHAVEQKKALEILTEEARGNFRATREESSERGAEVSSAGGGAGRSRHTTAREDGNNRGGGASTGSPVPSHAKRRDEEEEAVMPGFKRQFFSKYSFGIIFYSVLKALMYAFFTTGGENLLGKRVNDFLGAALPFSCIPCILLGKVVDLVGIMPVLLLLNSCITLAYAFSMIPSIGTAYLGALLYICYVSFYSSQSYCYVSDTFSSCHFGKLVGTIHMIAGLLSLLKIPMQSMVVHLFHSNYLYPCIIMLVFCAANFLVLIWLVILKRRDPHPFWPQSAREAAAAEKARRNEIRLQQKENMRRKQHQQHSQHPRNKVLRENRVTQQ